MAHAWAKPFYNSAAWAKCRDSYIAERRSVDGGLCECCRKELGYIVHHKVILTEQNIYNPDIALNHDNLSYECKTCHDTHEGHGVGGHGKAKALCLFDEEGNPISIREIDRA